MPHGLLHLWWPSRPQETLPHVGSEGCAHADPYPRERNGTNGTKMNKDDNNAGEKRRQPSLSAGTRTARKRQKNLSAYTYVHNLYTRGYLNPLSAAARPPSLLKHNSSAAAIAAALPKLDLSFAVPVRVQQPQLSMYV